MAGNGRFESSSGSPEDSAYSGSYSNGQRGGYSGASLDRSGSFRESGESRVFGSGASTPRGSAALAGDLPPINEYLNLEPVSIESQKFTRLGELRRALGIISFGSTAEDNSFGAAHSKPAPAVVTEELKRFKATVLEASNKAKSRKRMFDESSYKVNKYYEALSLKKQQRNEMMTNERLGVPNLSKVVTPSSRNPPELVNQKVEDRNKNVVVNKRVRSSVAETRGEGQTNGIARRMASITKDRAVLRDSGEGSGLVDEKIRRLPVAGEAWDAKMKRKRSVGPILVRHLDEGEPKRAMHYKLNNDPCSTSSSDAQTYRSGLLNGANKSDGASLAASSNVRAMPKSELDKVALSRDSMPGLSKERPKGSNKLNGLEDNQIPSPNFSIKGKASRGPRSGPLMTGNSSPNFSRASGPLEGWEQPASINKIHSVNGVINRNRPVATGASSPPMAQWVGQRPQKISRTRRANLVSPISNHGEVHTSPEDHSPSDMETPTPVSGTNGSLGRGMINGPQQFKVKHEMVSSPSRLSEGEDSGTCENRESRLKEKGVAGTETEGRGVNTFQNTVPLTLNTKKTKLIVKELGDGVRRQGRSGRGSAVSKVSTSPVKEKTDSLASAKPVKSTRVGSERSGSKSGRPPLKKMSERKGVARLGHINAIGSPDFSGEQDDDREELVEAASYACNFSNVACSGSFWKKMQSIFAPICLEDISYLKEQLKLMEVNYDSSSQMFGLHNTILDNCAREDKFVSQTHVSGGKGKRLQDQGQHFDNGGGTLDSEERKKVVPLYQRVLSALIIEDETEEFEEDSGAREYPFGADYERSTIRGPQNLLQHAANGFSHNDMGFISMGANGPNYSSPDNFPICNQEVPHLGNGLFAGFSENGVDGSLPICTNASGVYSLNCPYEQMSMEDKLLLELQSIGLYPEIVPNLTDGEDESITSDILELQKELSEQVSNAKEQLRNISEAAEECHEIEKRCVEQVAMDRLVELSYKKLLATRGSYASKHGLAKVPKPVAVAFMKRTLARYRKFEETGKSCFIEPALWDILYASPVCGNGRESANVVSSSINIPSEMKISQHPLRLSGSLTNWSDRDDHRNGKNFSNGFGNLTHSSEQDFAKTGPIMNRGKKKEIFLDDVGGGGGGPLAKAANNLSGGAKGKRSERDRDKDNSIRNAKPSRGPNNKGDRKTKVKPKNKTGQLSTSGVVPINGTQPENVGNGSGDNRKREAESPNRNIPIPGNRAAANESADFGNLSTELGVDENQDFSTWFTEEEDLQEDFSMGLQIPMDDLFEVLS